MINKKTALILGAGASYNYGYPLGNKLKNEIIDILNIIYNVVENVNEKLIKYSRFYGGDLQSLKSLAFEDIHPLRPDEIVTENNLVNFLLRNCNIAPDDILRFRNNFGRSHLMTIDTFLEERRELINLGKILIAIAIMKHEDDVLLKDEPINNKHWYKYLLNQFGTSWNLLESNNIKIITYNYDRTLEHYFVDSLVHTYGKENDYLSCIDLTKKFGLYHIHGNVEPLYSYGIGHSARPYWQKMTCQQIILSSESIEIVSEVNADEKYEQVYNTLTWADQIFILGFGYDKRNLERLKLDKYNKPIYSTRFGISNRELKEINAYTNNSILFSHNEHYDIIDFLVREVGLSGVRSDELPSFRFPFEY